MTPDADRAREFFHKLQDSIVEKNWKTEEARSRYRAARTPLFPPVYWNRTTAEASLAALIASVRAEAQQEMRERCIAIVEYSVNDRAAMGANTSHEARAQEGARHEEAVSSERYDTAARARQAMSTSPLLPEQRSGMEDVLEQLAAVEKLHRRLLRGEAPTKTDHLIVARLIRLLVAEWV